MTVYRQPGGIEDHLERTLHLLSDADLARAGLLRNTLAKQSNPNQKTRLSLEDAVKLDALMMSRGAAPVFLTLARQMLDGMLNSLRQEEKAVPIPARLLRVCAEVGDLARVVTVSMEDGVLDLTERRHIAREAQDVIDHAMALRDAVEPPAAGIISLTGGR